MQILRTEPAAGTVEPSSMAKPPAPSEPSSAVDLIDASFRRCTGKPTFLDRFYERFLRSDPSIGKMFERTDMGKQKDLLKNGLMMIVLFRRGSAAGVATLNRLGRTHGSTGMKITPDMYRHWTEALIGTMREHDPEWNPGLEREWRATARDAIDHMRAVDSQATTRAATTATSATVAAGASAAAVTRPAAPAPATSPRLTPPAGPTRR